MIQYLGLIIGRVGEKRGKKALLYYILEGPICQNQFFLKSNLATANIWSRLGQKSSSFPWEGLWREGRGPPCVQGMCSDRWYLSGIYLCARHYAVVRCATWLNPHKTPPRQVYHLPGFGEANLITEEKQGWIRQPALQLGPPTTLGEATTPVCLSVYLI